MQRDTRSLATRAAARAAALRPAALRPAALRPAALSAAAVAAVVLSGCSLALRVPTQPGAAVTAGPSGEAVSPSAGAVAVGAVPAVTDDEVPTPPGPEERTPAAAATAPAAVRAFAERYVNWTAGDVAAHLRQLAVDSVGQARTAMALEARQTGADPELAQAGVANHGVVEAVAALGGPGGRWVVVTRESTTATNSTAYAGLAPAWHLAVATVVRRGGGWVVSGWQPEN